MFNFYRHSPAQRGVDTVSRIDSKGHLCGELHQIPVHVMWCYSSKGTFRPSRDDLLS
jgi:hypothetical protein